MSRLLCEINPLHHSLQKKKKLTGVHSTNKAGKLRTPINSPPSSRTISFVFRDICETDPLLMSAMFNNYFASSVTTDENVVAPNILPASLASPQKF